ncbi:hypothetical protein PR202_ga26146 [Eleusine coracana subsp. coracana]|uniref:Uncharacterized protein n=1 Tax=Eleusine coracana subsp. coracana TaxID=191504 RepID=A0AAV5DDD7_ELECO|nr:hypothetical protein PR202_ga26146 [Eleusine coracana subsp. coracana]
MSWLRSAVHRAVEASGGRSSLLTRTVRTSLGTVVHHAGQAVAGGARLITGNRTYKSVKLTAKRLEDAALSYRGEERLHLLHRWLVALKENQRAAAALREPQPGDDPNHVPALLAKRDELLEFAQGAISGLKINADIARLDDEIMLLRKQLNAMDALQASSTSNPNNISQTITEVGLTVELFSSRQLLQREESLIFRVTKTNEVSGIDKELVAEISGLKKQRDQLEEELRKLKKTREERDQFDEASNQIVLHLKTKDVLSTSIDRIKTLVDNLKIFNDRSMSTEDGDSGSSKQSNPRKYLEEEYLDAEKKVVAAFTSVDRIRALFCCNEEGRARRDDPDVRDLFENIDKLRVEFESVPRPVLQIEIKEQEERTRQPRSFKVPASPNLSRCDSSIAPQLRTRLPSESDSEMGKFDQDYKADEISGWEFDELEDEPRSGF